MTNQEWEARMNELRDAQLVTQRLMERHERAWNERFEVLTSVMERHEERLDELKAIVAKHEDGIAEMRAALASLLKTFDRFIRGQGGNGADAGRPE